MRSALAILALAAAAAPSAASAATASWRLEQPPPPPGARFKAPLGRPGDLEFYAPNKGLLAVEGNSAVPRGLYFYNGAGWKQLSTVCGDNADSFRVAWAGPDEFWTISAPSTPRIGSGTALCHYKGGQVIASYSTPNESPDPYRTMTAARCNGPSDCWFGGIGSQDPSGQRLGAFHLHWDGTDLKSSYAPQGRGVSDMVVRDGRFYESTFAGVGREDRTGVVPLAKPEPDPLLIHSIGPSGFRTEPWTPLGDPSLPEDNTDLLAASAVGGQLWFAGGGAASGPDVPDTGMVPRQPVLVHERGDFLQQLPLPANTFADTDRFVDVAAIPGSTSAWVAVQPFAERTSTTARARVVQVDQDGKVTQDVRLPLSGAGRGAAAKVVFTGPNEGWMITTAGWLFHYTDGTALPVDDDPAFASTISFRPNEAAAQFIADTPPADDSQLFAPPPVDPAVTDPGAAQTPAKQLKALLTKVTKPKVDKQLRLRITFTSRRTAKIQLQARRGGKVVAKTKLKTYKPGRHTLRLQLSRKRYPTALKFVVRERGVSTGSGDGGDTTTTTTTTTRGARTR